jgi:hypothetical protein
MDCLVLIFVFSDMFFGVYKKQITDRKLNQLFMERGAGREGGGVTVLHGFYPVILKGLAVKAINYNTACTMIGFRAWGN